MTNPVLIVGAGPAGLTAACEIVRRSAQHPLIIEKVDFTGGLSRTAVHNGNRMDIGGHRFFSKSQRVLDWWEGIIPVAQSEDDPSLDRLLEPGKDDPKLMLTRQRVSRIMFRGDFYDYPLRLNTDTLRNLGVRTTARIATSYAKRCVLPNRTEASLEDFFINRFGDELYQTFFKDYTEKVWGVSCREIKPEWGAQRIKGLSIAKAIAHAATRHLRPRSQSLESNVETSLIERFWYPKLGPGQLWEAVGDEILERGGSIQHNRSLVGLKLEGARIVQATIRDEVNGELTTLEPAAVVSSMPVRELVAALGADVPSQVKAAASGLVYRDFITVGVLTDRLRIRNNTSIPTRRALVPDNWIYIQETNVKLGRLQIFNNWSPYMVADPNTVWLGLEYFCTEGDDLWSMPDDQLKKFAIDELARLGLVKPEDVLDSTALRVPKAYPAYFGTYDDFHLIRSFVDPIDNLYLIGRNGMHRYNNTDHSMLTAMAAVDHWLEAKGTKAKIWDINTEQEYHEEG